MVEAESRHGPAVGRFSVAGVCKTVCHGVTGHVQNGVTRCAGRYAAVCRRACWQV